MSPERGREASLTDVEIHDVLSNERRLRALSVLREEEGEVSVRELARRIAEEETTESPPPREARHSAYVSLHQTHLPKLDELGVVDYDLQAKTVSLAARAEEVTVHMAAVPKYDLSWNEYYAGLAILGLALVLGAKGGVPVLADVGAVPTAAAGFAAIIAAGLYRTVRQGDSVIHRLFDA